MKEYKGFKIGDEVTITKRPTSWSSSLHREYPLNLSFPRTIIIKNIQEGSETEHIAMTCGNYGWSLSSMIEEGCIIHDNSVKTLPEEYIVECGNKYETRAVGIALYPKDSIWGDMNHWNYIFFTESSKLSTREGICTAKGFNNSIYSDLEHLPVFTYNEWKQLFYKQEEMKKEFVLPEKWQILRDENNYMVINAWMNDYHQQTSEDIGHYEDKHGFVNNDNLHKMKEDFPEITFEQFKTYVLKEKPMKAQLFTIKGSLPLLKAMWEELTALGYYQEDPGFTPERKSGTCISTNQSYLTESKEKFMEIVCLNSSPRNEVNFTLPAQYNEALAFAKAQLAPELWEELEVKLPFAELTFTVNKSKGTATCKHGTITKAEIKAVIDAVVSPKAKLLGYDLEVGASNDRYLKFGCQKGTVREAQAILKALE